MKLNDDKIQNNTSDKSELNIILASSSPRRIEFIKNSGYKFEIMPSEVDESLPYDCDLKTAVMYLSLKKAFFVEESLKSKYVTLDNYKSKYPNSIILAADTLVYKDRFLGKPVDDRDAIDMIKSLSGDFHYVATGVSFIRPFDPMRFSICSVTKVFCKDISDEEIKNYIATGEHKDKAGAYGIQGAFGKYIDRIEGSYTNVIGLPMEDVNIILKSLR